MEIKNELSKGGEKLISVEMLLQQVQPSKSTNAQSIPGWRQEISEPFQRLLDESFENLATYQNQESDELDKEIVIDDLLQRLNIEIDTENQEKPSNAYLKDEQENGSEHLMIAPSTYLDIEEKSPLHSNLLGVQAFPVADFLIGTEQNVMTNTAVSEEIDILLTQIQTLISQLETEEEVWKASPKVLELLHQWQHFSKEKGTPNSLLAGQMPLYSEETNSLKAWKNEDTRESKIWNYIFDTFQKREHFAGKQRYNADSNVTVTDVAKWLGNAIEKENLSVMTIQSNQTVPISNLEQHVIHIHPLQPTQNAEQQLMDQFEKIVESTKLSVLPNQRNHLTVLLRPDNMGEMMVRFTQVNGEILVKILVTSAAAKEMLESNIHQLKNMFSPHQVVVERQDASLQQTANMQKEQEDGQLTEQEKQQSEQSEHKDNQQNEGSFESQFEELLMNEKV